MAILSNCSNLRGIISDSVHCNFKDPVFSRGYYIIDNWNFSQSSSIANKQFELHFIIFYNSMMSGTMKEIFIYLADFIENMHLWNTDAISALHNGNMYSRITCLEDYCIIISVLWELFNQNSSAWSTTRGDMKKNVRGSRRDKGLAIVILKSNLVPWEMVFFFFFWSGKSSHKSGMSELQLRSQWIAK